MRRYISVIAMAILMCVPTVSCSPENSAEFERIVWKIFPDLSKEDISYVIIVPNQGCGGCISSAEVFYNDNKNREELKFIFTNVISMKILRQRLGEINGNNTYLDTDNEAMSAYPAGKSIYPCVLEMGNNGIKNIYYQSPRENGLSIVENNLAEL